jgi:hypothetical protein
VLFTQIHNIVEEKYNFVEALQATIFFQIIAVNLHKQYCTQIKKILVLNFIMPENIIKKKIISNSFI